MYGSIKTGKEVERTQAVRELYLFFNDPKADWFTAMLFGLIVKADGPNLGKLVKAFPVEVSVFLEWRGSDSAEEFFRRYEVGQPPNEED